MLAQCFNSILADCPVLIFQALQERLDCLLKIGISERLTDKNPDIRIFEFQKHFQNINTFGADSAEYFGYPERGVIIRGF